MDQEDMPHSAVTLSTLWQFEGGRKSNRVLRGTKRKPFKSHQEGVGLIRKLDGGACRMAGDQS